jgi:sterol desaturase/sphingolipid hydroxylase (fatty acid hydroxylase superfamily)
MNDNLVCQSYELAYSFGKEYDLSDFYIGCILYGTCFLLATIPFNLFLAASYHYDWFSSFRIQRKKSLRDPPPKLVNKAILDFFIHYVLLLPVTVYFIVWGLMEIGMKTTPEDCPDYQYMLYYMVVCVFVSETVFYWAHRILHHKSLYKRFHKKHHEFNATIGIAFSYASTFESIFANLSNVVVPCIMLKGHIVCLALWIVIRSLESIDAHSAYQWPVPLPNLWFASFPCITGGAERHDFHHSHNTEMYGSFTGFWDWAMGTDKQFMEHRKRQRMLAKAQAQ